MRKWLFWSIGAVVAAGLILFVSLSWMSLKVLTATNGGTEVKGGLILNTTSQSYTLPQIRMMPTNPFYGLKNIRDWLWVTFSFSPLKKSQVSLLIADKKMAETLDLLKDQQENRALDQAQIAIETLKEAKLWAEKEEVGGQKATQEIKVWSAGQAYETILNQAFSSAFNLDSQRYSDLLKDLHDWNEAQKQEQKEKTI